MHTLQFMCAYRQEITVSAYNEADIISQIIHLSEFYLRLPSKAENSASRKSERLAGRGLL